MDRFIILKASRVPPTPLVREIDGYGGPTCADAGVDPGRVYLSRADAERDAKALSEVNPVGFRVLEVGKAWPECVRDHYENGVKRKG